MAIVNDAQLAAAAATVTDLLQQMQDYMGRPLIPVGRVGFPRGYLLSASHHRGSLPRLHPFRVSQNISYALLMNDVYGWLIDRTDIGSTAKNMIVKESICNLGAVCECLLKVLVGSRSFKNLTQQLVQSGVITAAEKLGVDEIWEYRNYIHLKGVHFLEHGHYQVADYNRCKANFDGFVAALKAHYG